MRHDVILVLLDGLNHSVARDCMGHLQALCGAGRGQSYRLECELPSLSRPLYECILTGVPPIDSGILHNDVVRLSQEQSLFHYARAAGLSTAAAAYHWVSELYNRAPFDPPATATPTTAHCRSSADTSTGATTIRTRTCSPTRKACAAGTHRTSCWSTR